MGQKRWVILLVVVALSFAVPAAVCATVALMEAGSVVALGVGCLAAGVWMALLVLVTWWEFTSRWLRWIWSGGLAGVVAWRIAGARALPVAW